VNLPVGGLAGGGVCWVGWVSGGWWFVMRARCCFDTPLLCSAVCTPILSESRFGRIPFFFSSLDFLFSTPLLVGGTEIFSYLG
jgi:hypothetical protein